MKILYLFSLLFLVAACDQVYEQNQENEIEIQEIVWKSFNSQCFEEAKETSKLVFLEVGANWCHWCHVMDDSTYSDRTIQAYLNENFVLTREDQDERPDLFSAYQSWGWPAIVIFNASGDELLKLKGYQAPKRFLKQLESVVNNPIPLTAENISMVNSTQTTLSNQGLIERFTRSVDHEKGGFNWRNKSLNLESINHGLRYQNENDSLKNWMDLTVEQSYLLVDPVWSGVYQYSALRSWNNQHYEKLLRYQADYIESYCRYGMVRHDKKAIETAKGILVYCKRFLKGTSPLFWNSQNADLISGQHSGDYYGLNEKQRLKQGVPSVDQKSYLKENAALISSLVWLWAATDDLDYLLEGKVMLDYILENFKTENGIYAREEGKFGIYSFEDNRRLIECLMSYAQVMGDQLYVTKARELGENCIAIFDSEEGIVAVKGDITLKSSIVQKSNLESVLTFNKLSYLTGEPKFKAFAVSTMGKLDQESLIESPATLPLLIRAIVELENEPFHAKFITSGAVQKLKLDYIKLLLGDKNPYFIFQTLENGKMTEEENNLYGGFDPGTLFMCTSSFCSAPLKDADDLLRFLNAQE